MSDMERILSALQRIEEAHKQLAMKVDAVSIFPDRSAPGRPALRPIYCLQLYLTVRCIFILLRYDAFPVLSHRTTTESPRSSVRSTISLWVDRHRRLIVCVHAMLISCRTGARDMQP